MTKEVELSRVAEIFFGQTFRGKAEAENDSSGIRLIQIRDIKEGYITDVANLSFAQVDSEKLTFRIQFNDLLLPVRGSRFEGAIFKGDAVSNIVTTTNQVAIFRILSSDKIRLEYLLWYLNSAGGRKALDVMSLGSTIPSISRKSLSSLKIPLPPLTVQEKIIEMYANWRQQREVLNELLRNGQLLVEQLCSELSLQKDTLDE